MSKKILIVNDDGIDSPLLLALVSSFKRLGEPVIAAPRHEQSWVSKSMSRFREVDVMERHDLPCRAYSISGTPADCVNLALDHLLDEQPLAVVSGINVGHNAGLAYILSSGTIGAAIEGCLHNIPSFAGSMGLARADYNRLKDSPDELGALLGGKARQAADIMAEFVASTLARKEPAYGIVHSLNFPNTPLEEAAIVPSRPALTQSGGFFQRSKQGYGFAYNELAEYNPATPPTDRQTLIAGKVSYTRLDFGQLGTRID